MTSKITDEPIVLRIDQMVKIRNGLFQDVLSIKSRRVELSTSNIIKLHKIRVESCIIVRGLDRQTLVFHLVFNCNNLILKLIDVLCMLLWPILYILLPHLAHPIYQISSSRECRETIKKITN